MRIAQSKLNVVYSVTKRVDKLSVKVLFEREMDEKSIISEHGVQAVYLVTRLLLLAGQKIGVFNLSVLR